MNAADKLSKAMTNLIITPNSAFFAVLALKKKLQVDPSEETAACDGETIFYNPEWIDGLTLPETTGILAHEVMHIALMHHTRMGSRDESLWNIAIDHAVNLILRKAEVTLPKPMLCDEQYEGKSVEDIYDVIYREKQQKKQQQPDQSSSQQPGQSGQPLQQPNQQPEQQQGQQSSQGPQQGQDKQSSKDPGKCGRVKRPSAPDGGPPSEADITLAEQKAVIDTLQAAQSAKGVGFMPACLKEYIDELKEPEVDWRYVLREFVERVMQNDYSWQHPNRRYMPDVYLPSLYNRGAGEVIIAVDTSGSINSTLFNQFLGECQAILDEMKPESMRIIQCDSSVKSDDEYRPGDTLKATIQGRGGTQFQPIFDHVDKEGYIPACLVYFTDLDCYDTPRDPGYPVLWMSYGKTNSKHIKFGEIIPVKRLR